MKDSNDYRIARFKRRNRKKYLPALVLILVFLGASGVYGGYRLYKDYLLYRSKVDLVNDPEIQNPTQISVGQTSQAPAETIPSAKVLDAPYTVQAPLNNWNIHEQSCEEAALLMYHYFLEGQLTFNGGAVITPTLANDEEIKMKAWEVKNYGREPDLTMAKLGQFATDYYGYKYKAINNATEDDIKEAIAAGHPVVVPVITHALQNPYYGREPAYHVLFIKGYKSDGVITNDAGVRQGENYFYTWNVLFSAIDAQTPQMGQGRVMVYLTK